jgi:glycosyltransferase involved in cell wall biosynthesis
MDASRIEVTEGGVVGWPLSGPTLGPDRILWMKIIFLCHRLDRGGAQRQMAVLARGLADRGWQPLVITWRGGGGLESWVCEQGLRAVTLGHRTAFDLPRSLFRLVRFVRAFQADILHGYTESGNLLATVGHAFYPRSRLVWGVRSSQAGFEDYEFRRRLQDYLVRRLCSRAHAIIVNSQAGLAQCVAAGYPADRCTVIPNGIDTNVFCPDPKSSRGSRAALGLGDDEFAIGVVARLDPIKDFTTLVRALGILNRGSVRFKALLVGDISDAAYAARIRQLALQQGIADRLVWVGGRDDLPNLYRAFDITVLTSERGEGFPNVVGESMASCTVCIATDVGDAAAILGDTGSLIAPGRPAQLARELQRWARRDREALQREGEAARRRIVDHFSVDTLVDTSACVLNGIVANRSVRKWGAP